MIKERKQRESFTLKITKRKKKWGYQEVRQQKNSLFKEKQKKVLQRNSVPDSTSVTSGSGTWWLPFEGHMWSDHCFIKFLWVFNLDCLSASTKVILAVKL